MAKTGLSSRQLDMVLRRNIFTRPSFIGVFAADQISKIKSTKKYPHCFIINTDPLQRIGRHWQCCWVQSPSHAEFFCSLGQTPTAELAKYLAQFKTLKTNEDQQIQADTADTCGFYCLYFLLSKAQDLSYEHILETLRKTGPLSDLLIKHFVRHFMILPLN